MAKAVQLLRAVAILLCLLSVMLTLNSALAGPGQPQPPTALDVVLPFILGDSAKKWIGILVPIAIAAMFWRSTRELELQDTSRFAIILLAVQTALAFLVAEELQFVIAVEAGLLLSTRAGSLWVVAQASAAWIVSAIRPELMSWILPQTASQNQRLMNLGMFMLVAMLYNLLAFSLGLLAAAEGRQRRQLETVNRELLAAQWAMLETARLSERLRLSRELHDAVGHQLTALSINLQIAIRLSHDQARPPVLEAYELAGRLLSDVRAVVSATRNVEHIDFEHALREIADRVNSPQIHLDLQAAPLPIDETRAHALFRCAQEIITNTIKHADAAHLWIATRSLAGEFLLSGWDDGRGNPGLQIGNGLRGIEERLRELGGTCVFGNKAGAGFEVVIRVPCASRVSA